MPGTARRAYRPVPSRRPSPVPTPTPEQRADLEAFLDEQLADLPLEPAEDARLRRRIRALALADAEDADLDASPGPRGPGA